MTETKRRPIIVEYEYMRDVLRIARATDHEEELGWHFGPDGKDQILFTFDCSDTFMWGCADSEPIHPEDVLLLKQCVKDLTEISGATFHVRNLNLLYAARKRGMRPMRAWFAHYEKNADDEDRRVMELLLAAGPVRDPRSEG